MSELIAGDFKRARGLPKGRCHLGGSEIHLHTHAAAAQCPAQQAAIKSLKSLRDAANNGLS